MAWFYFAIAAYSLLAISGVIDKFLVSKVVKHPVAYAFYMAATGPLSLLLAPFGLVAVAWSDFYIAAVGGACFIVAMYFYFIAVSKASVSRVLPIFGGLIPVFTLALAYFALHERLTTVQYAAFIFLVFGTVLVAYKKESGGWQKEVFVYGALAALMMALSAVLSKYIFDVSNFVTGMVWTRMGFIPMALFFLLGAKNREYIFNAPKEAKPKNILIYYISRFSGTIAGFLQNYAVSLGSVTVVNALQGTQFAFLLLMTTGLSVYFPRVLKEQISASIMTLKILAIAFISGGLILLAL